MTESKLKITIITPTYNSERYLEETITSVIGQSYNNIEYIIVDGGSEDSTLNLIQNYKQYITHVISEPDQGIYDALNKGISISTGDIILCLNSDDFLYSSTIIAEVAELFDCQSDLKIVYGNLMVRDDFFDEINIIGEEINTSKLRSFKTHPNHQAFFAHRSLYLAYQCYDLQYLSAADMDFMLKCFKNHMQNAYYLDSVISVYRLGGLSSNEKTAGIYHNELRAIFNKHFDFDIGERKTRIPGDALLYKVWLNLVVCKQKHLLDYLVERKVKNVAIVGSLFIGILLLEELRHAGIHVLCFLDNDKKKHNLTVKGLKVHPLDWLNENIDLIDGVIIAIENETHIGNVKKQLMPILKAGNIFIKSWKDLLLEVRQNFDWYKGHEKILQLYHGKQLKYFF